MNPSERLEMKIDHITEKISSIDVTLAKQAVILDEHVRRTEAAEKRIEQVTQEIKPIKNHVIQVNGVFKFLGLAGTGVGILAALVKLASSLFLH